MIDLLLGDPARPPGPSLQLKVPNRLIVSPVQSLHHCVFAGIIQINLPAISQIFSCDPPTRPVSPTGLKTLLLFTGVGGGEGGVDQFIITQLCL